MWEVEDGGTVRRFNDEHLRRMLRAGELSGTELVKPEGAQDWVRLYDTALYRSAVPGDTSPPRRALARSLRELGTHVAVFVAVMVFLGFPWWGLFWGVGVLAHALKDGPGILAAWRAPETLPEPAAVGALAERGAAEARSAGLPAPSRPDDDPLQHAIARVRAELATSDAPVPDSLADELAALATAGAALSARIDRLAEHADPDTRARLADEAATLRARLDAAHPDDPLGPVHRRELDAVTERLATLDEAAAVRERLEAERRIRVHEVEGLRALLASASAASDAPSLLEEVREVRARVAAEAEVEGVGRP